MKLPNGENARIDPEKLSGYMLSPTHPVGRFKARFFLGLGFSVETAGELGHALLEVAATAEVRSSSKSRYGTKYVVDGELRSPAGKVAPVRTVWVLETGDDRPRLVTAYPAT